MHVNSLDDGLCAGLSRTDAGLTASPWIHSATRGDLLKSHHTWTTLAGAALAEAGAVQLSGAVETVAHQKPAAVVAVRRWPCCYRGGSAREDGAEFVRHRIIATAVDVLIGKGLAVGGVEGDVLRRAIEGGAEFEQLAIGAPAGALLSFSAEIPQVGNGLLSKGLGVFRGIHQHIHQTVEALVAEDRERLAEFLEGADAPAEEVAVSQFHHAAVDETVVELLAVFLAAAKGANEFAH